MFLSSLGPPYNRKVGFQVGSVAKVTIGFSLPLCHLCSGSSEENECWRPLCLGTFGFVAFSRPVFLAFCFFNLETLYTVYVPTHTDTPPYTHVHKLEQKSPCMPDVMHEDLVVLCISE